MNVDFVDMECDINKYKVLAVPMLYMFREGFESKIRNFVEKGGTLIMTYWSGVVDNNDRAYLGGTPYGLIEVLGLRFEEIDGLYENDSNEMVPVMGNSLQMDKKYCCTKLCELVKTEGAEVLMAYGTDFYEGRPVLTRNKYRNGEAYYVCSDGEQEFFDELCKKVADDKKLYKSLKYDIPYGVAVSERIKDGTKYIFIQNYNNYEVTMDVTGENVMFGNTEGRISAYGTIIIKR
jgi:beta-galactosidase